MNQIEFLQNEQKELTSLMSSMDNLLKTEQIGLHHGEIQLLRTHFNRILVTYLRTELFLLTGVIYNVGNDHDLKASLLEFKKDNQNLQYAIEYIVVKWKQQSLIEDQEGFSSELFSLFKIVKNHFYNTERILFPSLIENGKNHPILAEYIQNSSNQIDPLALQTAV